MILLIVLSFGIIGATTIWYTRTENEKYHFERLARKERAIIVSLQYYLKGKENDSLAFYTREFHEKVQELADINNLDVNLFDLEGQAISSSDFGFFDLGYIPEKLSLEHLQEINDQGGALIWTKQVGDETYLFALKYLMGENNKPLAIINIPYYRSEQAFKEETTIFLKALVQVYGFMLLLGLAIAYLLSNSVTKGLKKLENKIRDVSLQDSYHEISWHANDEIGSLVEAYNQKVRELEKSVAMLAEKEREGAWKEMAKQVAHEIKNPLTPMLLQVQLLQRSWDDKRDDFPERLARFHKTMTEQIETLSRIATEFSTFAKLPEAQFTTVDLNSVIEGVAALFHHKQKHAVKLNLAQPSPMVYADKDQLNRLFNNLIGNAVEAIEEGKEGIIEITTSFVNQQIRIDITDNGSGISEDKLEHIFQPNFTTKTSGTGLGLAMVKRIVDNTKGSISVKSQLGSGSTFSLILPAK